MTRDEMRAALLIAGNLLHAMPMPDIHTVTALQYVEAVADALVERTCEHQWQPIGMEPKNGLAFVGLTWNNETCAVFWCSRTNAYRYAGDGWHSGNAPRLTHWQPLPPAPQGREAGTP